MKKRLISILVAALAISVISPIQNASAATKVSAFPGSEGGGKYATGGRGGSVYYVTNLNDSGTGSFRDAVSKPNRIVLFKVGGTIELKSDVVISSNITIAGQTAPGGAGITLKNFKAGLGGSNIIMRFISSRPGERGKSAEYDALGGANGSNSIVDHCSFGWANDEQWGLYSNNLNYTTQWSVVGPSNSFSYHSKGIHGFAVMLGKGNCSWHHNMIVDNVSRNFRGKVEGTYTADFVNNVIYNWAYQTAYGTIGHLNYVGNYLKMGPNTKGGYNYVSVDSTTNPDNFKMYLADNKFVDNKDKDYKDFSTNNWSGITYSSSNGRNESNVKANAPFKIMDNGDDLSVALKVESAESAYNNVLKYSGAGISSDLRTAIDKQVMNEAKTGTGQLVGARAYSEANSSQKDTIDKYGIKCGVEFNYPEAITTGAPKDSDNDGMPDFWEIERNLNPNNASDANDDYCGQGYTNIEYYLNDLTVDAFPKGTVIISPKKNSTSSSTTEKQDVTPANDITNNAVYTIKNKKSNLFMEVTGGTAANGTNIQQWGATNPASYNTWKLVSAGNDYYYIYSELGDGNTYTLDVTGGKATDNTNVELYTKNTSNAQLYRIIKNSDGTYSFLTKASSLSSCVEVAASSTSSGANVQQNTFTGADNQKWILTKVNTNSATKPSTEVTNNLKVDYTINNWGSTNQVNFKITNNSSSTISTWTLKVKKSDVSITTGWNINLSESGDYYVITPVGWNSSIAPGQSIEFGTQGNGNANKTINYLIN